MFLNIATPLTVNQNHPLARHLRFCMMFNESGPHFYDVSGYPNIGTLSGTKAYKEGRLEFVSANSNYVAVPSPPSLNNWAVASVEVWFKWSASMASFARLIEKGDNSEWTIAWNYGGTNKLSSQTFGGTGLSNTTSIAFNDDKWHQVIFVFDSVRNNQTLFVDGIFDNQLAASNTISTKVGNLSIGGRSDGSYMNGGIQLVRIYGSVINPNEVNNLYQDPYAMFRFENQDYYKEVSAPPPTGNYGAGLSYWPPRYFTEQF